MKGLAGAGGREASKQAIKSLLGLRRLYRAAPVHYLFIWRVAAVGHVPVWTATRAEHDCSNESQRTKPDNADNKEHTRTGGMTSPPPAPWENWESIF